MAKKVVMGIYLSNRIQEATQVQGILTEYGCCIKTRIGLHDVSDKECSPSGLILIEIHPHQGHCLELEQKLTGIEGVEVQKMIFE